MSGVSTICFAASYAIAFAMEITRLWLHSAVRSVILFGFAGAGFFAHTAFLYYRAVQAVDAPLSSEQDWFLVAAWALVAVYLCAAALYPKAPFGLFLLPLSLILIGAGTFLAKSEPLANSHASVIWGAIHGLSIMLAAVSVFFGCMAGMMYFVQAGQLKRKRMPGPYLRLPSLEWLQKANSRAIVFSVLMLAIGVIAGLILNRIEIGGQAAKLPWSDPVIVSTLLLLVWLLVAGGISLFYRPARQSRKVAYLTLVSFVFLLIVLMAGLIFSSSHWERRRSWNQQEKPENQQGLLQEPVSFQDHRQILARGLPLSKPAQDAGRQSHPSFVALLAEEAGGLPC